MMLPLANDSGDQTSMQVVGKQPEKVVKASLRKLPPSRSNPTQN